MNNLVIVESASKCKTIEKLINNSSLLKGNFKVIASSGHIIDLPTKEIGIDTTTWKIKYEKMKNKSKQFLRWNTILAKTHWICNSLKKVEFMSGRGFHLF